MKTEDKQFALFEIALLTLISAFAYLLFVNRLGYYKDDWYLMYLAHSQGPSIFKDIFAIDRPARGVLLQFLYTIFSDHALYFNLSSYFFRLLSSIGFLWALKLLWPQQKTASFCMALLFLIYPGYLSQVNAIDYQAYTMSLCCAMCSIALTFKSVLLQNRFLQMVTGVLSILLGWWYLGLVEYFIGFEALRLLGLFLLAMRAENSTLRLALKKFMWTAIAFVSIPAVFIFWRVFIFQNERKATSVSAQLGRIVTLPSLTSAGWLFSLVRDFINVIFSSWFVPLYNMVFQSRLRDMLLGCVVAGLAAIIVFFVFRRISPEEDRAEIERWRTTSMWIGLIAAIAGLVPIILSNRHVDFAEYSRYALPGAVGGVMALTGMIYYLPAKTLRIGVISSLIFIATFVHYLNGSNVARETAAVDRFWWQVSWRAPQIAKGTTLIVHYAAGGIPEDYVVWGPANLIYYPQAHPERPVNTDLYAALLTNENIANVLMTFGNDSELGRGSISNRDFKKVLILTQTNSSCVHILDGQYSELSIADEPGIMLLASHSDIENVLPNETSHTPPQVVFGASPSEDDWCFYYQKASLARQQRDWNTIAQLGKEVAKLQLHPNDQIEWMPFLQAAAALDNKDDVKKIAQRINVERFYKQQACENLRAMNELTPSMQSYISELFCGG